jgi:signal-transduction protein with cAMP-binding, CBS, and nucleotidyltransferase domain
MKASDLISDYIPPLKHTDTGDKALRWMDEFRVSHLPVIKQNNFVGIVSETDILDKTDPSKSLDELFDVLPRPYVYEHNHLYDMMRLFSETKCTVLPVLNEKEVYMGSASLIDVMTYISSMAGIGDNGSVLVIEVSERDYSLAHIAQCVETNNARLLSAFITSHPNSAVIEVTLKINQNDLSRIIQTFERFQYTIVGTFHKDSFYDDMQRRYDELMKFLDI